jgi:predicted GNAT superfamily acetyltransferase
VSVLRPIGPDDRAQVLAWNHAHVELLAPLDEDRLLQLLGWADLGAVITHDGLDVGFVLTFAAGTAYDSPNYRWFTEHAAASGWDAFYYLDRVVVDPSVRRAGIGTRVYDEVEERARRVAPVMYLVSLMVKEL